jgi:acyl transferase domain-containing protein
MTQKEAKNEVAVIGMSCRFAGANNPDELWPILSQAKDVITLVPKGRWWSLQETEAYFLKDPVDTFDHRFLFGKHWKTQG